MTKTLITCDCLGSNPIDAQALSQATGLQVRRPCSALCTTQIDQAVAAVSDPNAIFCCTQEARLFAQLAEELGADAPHVLDLRDRAGWSADPASK
ncbi:MAG: (4Fe-4S)-binding protein, partial [Lutimaribacter sp.]